MKKRVTRNLRKSLSVIMSAFVLLVGGTCFVGFGSNEVQAEGTLVMSSDGRYGTVPKNEVVEGTDGVPVYEDYLFAGWMKENSDGTLKVISTKSNATHAKFVPEELLTVKAQSTQDVVLEIENSKDGNKYAGKYVMRFVSSVESLDYFSVGYEVMDENGTKYTNTADDVCYRIDSTTNGADYTFSPKVINVESEYFITAKFPVEPGDNNENLDDLYTVRAFWKTLDGTTVYSKPRKLSVADGLRTTSTLNLSFVNESNVEIKEDDILSVVYDENQSATATVIGVDNITNTVHVRIELDKSSLNSVTEFQFSASDGTALGSSTYRNLYTSYTETTVDEVTTDTADTSWYNTTDDEFVIATSADLYGLAKIVNGTATDITADTFADKTIYVVSDIEANKGQSTTSGWSTTKDAEGKDITDGSGTAFSWTPIGQTTAFAGTFNGNMHTISGIYAEASTGSLGLFAATAKGSSIKNLKLENSYFNNTLNDTTNPNGTGSIVGQCAGNLVNIYSDAYVVAVNFSGGLVGQILTNSDYTLYIQKCWFDGSIKATKYQQGGIVGSIRGGTIIMEDCLNTGSIDCNKQKNKGGGGLCGRVLTDVEGYSIDLTMWNCLNYGEITNSYSSTKASDVRTSSVVGEIFKSKSTITVDMKNVYVREGCYTGTEQVNGCGYMNTTTVNLLGEDVQITKVSEIQLDTWGFDTLIWGIADDGTPMLNMIPVATE